MLRKPYYLSSKKIDVYFFLKIVKLLTKSKTLG